MLLAYLTRPQADGLRKRLQRLRSRGGAAKNPTDPEGSRQGGHQQGARGMSSRGTQALVLIDVEAAVYSLSLNKSRPRRRTLDLHLDEARPLVGTGPAADRLVERGEGEEIDEEGADDQGQDARTAIHGPEAIGTSVPTEASESGQ